MEGHDLCDICKYKNEECVGDHCWNCDYDYKNFKLDYIEQIVKDFNCSRSLAKRMYHSMIVTYCIVYGKAGYSKI